MVAILFEGRADHEFLKSLLETYTLPIKNVSFQEFEGKDNIFNVAHKNYAYLEQEIKAGKIDKILIVMDADNDKDPNPYRGFDASKAKIEETIDNLGFTIPVDYYMMCDENKEGNLESFLLSVLDDEQKKCIESFRNCFQYELTDKWVYYSFYKHNKHPFDFSHPNFDDLKSKLTNLFNESH